MKSSRAPLPAVWRREIVGDIAVEEKLICRVALVEKSQLRGPGWRAHGGVLARAHRALGFRSGGRGRRRVERDALLGGEVRESLVGERLLLGFLEIDVGHVDRVAGDAGAAEAFWRSSSTMSWGRFKVSPLPPMVPIIPAAISFISAVAFLILGSVSEYLGLRFCPSQPSRRRRGT